MPRVHNFRTAFEEMHARARQRMEQLREARVRRMGVHNKPAVEPPDRVQPEAAPVVQNTVRIPAGHVLRWDDTYIHALGWEEAAHRVTRQVMAENPDLFRLDVPTDVLGTDTGQQQDECSSCGGGLSFCADCWERRFTGMCHSGDVPIGGDGGHAREIRTRDGLQAGAVLGQRRAEQVIGYAAADVPVLRRDDPPPAQGLEEHAAEQRARTHRERIMQMMLDTEFFRRD